MIESIILFIKNIVITHGVVGVFLGSLLEEIFSVIPSSGKLNLSPFEIKKIEALPFVGGKNRVRETTILTLTVFELGDLTVPAFPVYFKNGSGSENQVLTEPVRVKVVSVGKKPTDKDDIRPIKGPVSFGIWAFWSLALGVLVALLAVFLAVKIIMRRRKKTIMDLESLKPPHERVFLELGRLKQKGFLEAGVRDVTRYSRQQN